MKEIEVKILNVDLRRVKQSLEELGAKSVLRPTLLREWYFRIPGISEDERNFYSLRLRTEGKKNVLAAKIRKEDKRYHINKEVEIEVSDTAGTKTLLALLGFSIFRQREKIRQVYCLDSIKIAIDQYPRVKPYIEIEGGKKSDIMSFVKKLGYSTSDTTNKTATEIIKETGLNPNNLFFRKKGKG